MLALARRPPSSLALVTFGEDEDEAAVRAHFRGAAPRELGFVLDRGRAFAEAIGVQALPAAFLVVDGRLLATFLGPRDWESRGMRRLLSRLASEGSATRPAGAAR